MTLREFLQEQPKDSTWLVHGAIGQFTADAILANNFLNDALGTEIEYHAPRAEEYTHFPIQGRLMAVRVEQPATPQFIHDYQAKLGLKESEYPPNRVIR